MTAKGIDPRIPKTALITGAARRIGRGLALALGREGWSVAVHYHGSESDARDAVSDINDAGGKAIALQADLGNEAQVSSLVPRAVEAFGPLGCLVNNASTFEDDSPATASRESWDRHIEPNLRAPFVLCQQVAGALPDTARGVIVNILDQRVWNLTPFFTSYTLSKAGLWVLTQTLALALAPKIRVNAIGPGPVLPSPRQTQEQFAQACDKLPLRQGTSVDEIADALFFILRAKAMTGTMIPLDGGQHLGWAQPGSGVPVE